MNQQLIINDRGNWDKDFQFFVLGAQFSGQDRQFYISMASMSELYGQSINKRQAPDIAIELHFDIEDFIEQLDIEEELASQSVIYC
ncbi:hypothetical protein DBZ36_00020 [Alginatibacterium sediminis]|uniref:Uncharacterized protein n=1 Tax=Alginatibacterium sediminis TaxID=2164068 RepID=A0A420EN11_9ALTE|nr:hypothetical protein [Alginatibacterium sediminis]RKF22070.1 hypothetical protein DBZ36_00020 [Alginatibacterium sediminis]